MSTAPYGGPGDRPGRSADGDNRRRRRRGPIAADGGVLGVLERWRADPEAGVVHVHELPARKGAEAHWPGWLPHDVTQQLVAAGINRPWRHQLAAAELARAGRHVVIATGTGSGKSLAYLLPVAEQAFAGQSLPPAKRPTALYLSPTKALGHDQARALVEFDLPGLRVATLDGDSSDPEREWARRHAGYLLTNPDMLHRSILPRHERHRRLLANLAYVVIDECHHYRGVFGTHLAQVLRRLRRICRFYGADPVFVLASATMADPEVTAARLVGAPVESVTEDTSPRGRLAFALMRPEDDPHRPGAATAHAHTAKVLADLVAADARTVAFVRSRRSAETIALSTRGRLRTHDPVRAERVASYRGGYLAEDRRVVERALTRGDLLAVAATNALELGVDITGLDAVVLAGFPGTRASLWQQVGRAGRRGQDAVAVLVAGADPLDQYLVSHPELLFSAGLEATSFDPDNPYVVAPHLAAAAAELPLTPADLTAFGAHAPRLVDELESAGLLRRRPAGWFWARRSRASDLTDIRGEGAAQVTIVEVGTGRLIGTVDAHSADTTVHDGAVYLHQGETYLVLEFDLRAGVAVVRPAPSLGYTTAPRVQSSVTIRRVRQEQGWGAAHVHFGDVRVTAQAVGYLRRRSGTGEVIGEVALDLPERHLDTSSVWFTLDHAAVVDSGIVPGAVAGAAHAAEHAAISLLPLVASCDRWDVGGLSIREHPQTGTVTVFVHDGLPGGAGLAERAFGTAEHWLAATRTAIATCRCDEGCPSCVQSPKCGNGNNPLDKQAAVHLLDAVLDEAPATRPHPPPADLPVH